MAEVTVSVDDEGAAQVFRGVGAHQEAGDADTPPVAGEQLPPLPPEAPVVPAPPSASPYGSLQPREAPATRPIMPDEWVRDEDEYWDTQSLIAVSGRLAVPRPKPLPLDPPQRFRPVRRWQSLAALVILSVVILVACVATLRAVGLARNVLHPPQAVPTLTHPAGSPTLPPSPTAKPHK